MKKVISLIVVSVLIFSCTVDGAWDLLRQQYEIFRLLVGYDNRVKITINNSAQNEDFINFPVLVILNAGRVTYSNISADGSGIKFISSDYSKEFPYEVEEWDPIGDSFFWVNIPSITSLSNSNYFWIYYSTDSNSDSTNSNSVWNNGYLAVWHMNDIGGAIEDSTSFKLDGITSFFGGPGSVAGKISGAQNFLTDSSKITISDAAVLDNAGPVTYSFWMYDNAYIDQDIIFKKGSFEIKLLNTETIDYFVDYDGGIDIERAFDDSWIGSEWHSFHLTWTGEPSSSKINIFADGLELTAASIHTNGDGNRVSDIGSDLIIGNDSLDNSSFEGYLDEIRISNIVRTPGWIKAQYLTMTDNFLTFGPEEPVSN